jgi:ribokinase/sulfofructose kinase
MTAKTLDLLCIGNPCADVVIRCDRLPAWDDKCAGAALGTYAGGTESNVACAASRLGWSTAVLGEVGDDAHGRFLLDAFVADKVSTRWVAQRAQCASASTVLMVSPEGERAIIWVPMPPAAWPPARMDEALTLSRWAYTMPYDAAMLAMLYAATQRRGAELAIDVEREAACQTGHFGQLLAHCDVAFMNESGYTAALGRVPDEAGLRALWAQGQAHTIVVTLGARGAIGIDAHGVVAVPARAVQVVDATGAGDSFNAAFLVARARTDSLQDALRFACDAASMAIGKVGARSAMVHLADMPAMSS